MAFGDDLNLLLPSYLTVGEKNRLRDALSQFQKGDASHEIDYSDFYKEYNHSFFLQADLLREIRFAQWDESSSSFLKAYTDAIIISNTCDIYSGNNRTLNDKECLLAPLIDFQLYLEDLTSEGYEEAKIKEFSGIIRNQLSANIFYLPTNFKDKKEYIVFLDTMFWFPTRELNSYLDQVGQTRVISLSLFGHYLLALKVSYHLCRLPEQCDRENMD